MSHQATPEGNVTVPSSLRTSSFQTGPDTTVMKQPGVVLMINGHTDFADANPTAGGGIDGEIGSFYFWIDTGTPKLYWKIGAADTAWQQVL